MTKTLFHGTEKNSFATLEAGHEAEYEYYGDAVYFSEYKSVADNYGKNIWTLELDLTEYKVIEFDAKNRAVNNYKNQMEELIASDNDVIIIRNTADNNRLGNVPFYTQFGEDKPEKAYSESGTFLYDFIYNTKKNRTILTNANIPFTKGKNELFVELSKEMAQKLHENGFGVLQGWRETPEHFDTYIIKNQSILNKAIKGV